MAQIMYLLFFIVAEEQLEVLSQGVGEGPQSFLENSQCIGVLGIGIGWWRIGERPNMEKTN